MKLKLHVTDDVYYVEGEAEVEITEELKTKVLNAKNKIDGDIADIRLRDQRLNLDNVEDMNGDPVRPDLLRLVVTDSYFYWIFYDKWANIPVVTDIIYFSSW